MSPRWLAVGVLLLASLAGAADEDGEPATPKERACHAWALDATLGGSQALQGKPRRIVPLKRGKGGIPGRQFIEHLFTGVDGIAAWEGEYSEEAIFYGYDWVMRHKEKGDLPITARKAYEMFFQACMSREEV